MSRMNKLKDMSVETIEEIYDLLIAQDSLEPKDRISQREIARRYNVSQTIISRIKTQHVYYIRRSDSTNGDRDSGHKCASCGVWFKGTNGSPALCQFCIDFLTSKRQRVKYPLSKFAELG